MRQRVREILETRTSDGLGGSTSSISKARWIDCKVSISRSAMGTQNVARDTGYGVQTDNVLTIVSMEPLREDATYEFEGLRYRLRKGIAQGRFFYSSLVETVRKER